MVSAHESPKPAGGKSLRGAGGQRRPWKLAAGRREADLVDLHPVCPQPFGHADDDAHDIRAVSVSEAGEGKFVLLPIFADRKELEGRPLLALEDEHDDRLSRAALGPEGERVPRREVGAGPVRRTGIEGRAGPRKRAPRLQFPLRARDPAVFSAPPGFVAYIPEYELITSQVGYQLLWRVHFVMWDSQLLRTHVGDWRASLMIPIFE